MARTPGEENWLTEWLTVWSVCLLFLPSSSTAAAAEGQGNKWVKWMKWTREVCSQVKWSSWQWMNEVSGVKWVPLKDAVPCRSCWMPGMIRWWSSNRGGRGRGRGREGENHLSQKVSSHLWCKQLEISQPASQPLCAISPVRVPSYYNRFARSFFSPCFLFFLSRTNRWPLSWQLDCSLPPRFSPFTISIFLRLSCHRFY